MGEALFELLLSLGLSVLFGVEAKRPNIVFIVADDLGKLSFVNLYHHLTCWSQTHLSHPLRNRAEKYRVKSGNFGHQVNSDIHLQTLEIQMRRLLMSRLIRIFIVCIDNWFFIPIVKI